MSTPEPIDPLLDTLPSRYVVGIDLGTTNSAVTYIDTEESPWKIRVLSIAQLVAPGETETLDALPSFYFQPVQSGDAKSREPLMLPWDKKPPSFCVGAYARDETAKTSGRGIASAKSWLCHTSVDRTAALLPWQGAGDVKRLSPVEVSGEYLKHVRESWDQRFPSHPLAEQDIVLTLPASFDEVARELTINAASIAGLARVVLIEEPQAAFYAWVYKHESDWENRVTVGQKILVCDIGGGTTDFTLIRVRKSGDAANVSSNANSGEEKQAHKIQFHRVAVGNHLILGGDNLDLAIAKHLEQKITGGGKLEAYQWDVLVGSSRNVKEQMLSDEGSDTITVSLPSRGSKLIGGSMQTEITRQELRELIVSGFLPEVPVTEKPLRHASGFQEFGLPYASDPGITRYLADFLTTHALAGDPISSTGENGGDVRIAETDETVLKAKPDVVLFNGGFFASTLLREKVVEQISRWFQSDSNTDWSPEVLENDRLDLAVARGAAYYGIVRRDKGVRIAASLARSYYIGIGTDDTGVNQAICIMPGNAEPGQTFTLEDRTFMLTISQPVEFSIYVSSIRLADQPGQILNVDPEQMNALPPIRTVLRAKSRNEKRDVAVKLQIGLTEIGTIDLACLEQETDRSWKLQFDIRSTTQTDVEVHSAAGESQGFLDEQTWRECENCIANVFDESNADNFKDGDPNHLVQQLCDVVGLAREDWPMPFLRRIWESLMAFESNEKTKKGRRKSAKHESRWLNLLGFALRPGYGVAMDDWRVTESLRKLRGKLIHGSANIQNESLVLWRRLSGGLTRGQQIALAEPLMASLRALEKQMAGKPVKGKVVPVRPEESIEVWRFLGSLELLSEFQKVELGNLVIKFLNKPRLKNARNAMIWALGRLGQRTPLYGPLNTVVNNGQAQQWISELTGQYESSPIMHLAVVQMARKTNDRYRDVDSTVRKAVANWLTAESSSDHLVRLVTEGGAFDAEEQGKVFGESLPQGLRILNSP